MRRSTQPLRAILSATCCLGVMACQTPDEGPVFPPAGSRNGSSPDTAFAVGRGTAAQDQVLRSLDAEVLGRSQSTIRDCPFVTYQVRQAGQAQPRSVYFNVGIVPVPGGETPCALRPPGLFRR